MKLMLFGIWIMLLLLLAHLTPQFGVVGVEITFTSVIISVIIMIVGFFIGKNPYES